MKNYKEIGSEFWLESPNEDNDWAYVLSGRTAIDLILQDLRISGCKMNSVYMPAWCCDSMLQPFIDRGTIIKFYDVSYIDGQLQYRIDSNYETDILYVTNYFGYDNVLSTEIVEKFKDRKVSILYDRTHSLFRRDDEMTRLADYTYASIRKWMGIPCGAYIYKNGGRINLQNVLDFPYLREKIDAMRMKADFIHECGKTEKQTFLNMYTSFGHHLAEDYRNYKMDLLSLHIWHHADKEGLKNRRCSNAATLQLCLQEMSQLNPMFTMIDGDCPLFVPVLLDSKEERDALREHLTANSIYCPIHWPKPSLINEEMAVNNIYDHEISLVCDQRYDYNDMQYILSVIKDYYRKTQ